jgi:hypothetical protein
MYDAVIVLLKPFGLDLDPRALIIHGVQMVGNRLDFQGVRGWRHSHHFFTF